jgi:hypothetical protein
MARPPRPVPPNRPPKPIKDRVPEHVLDRMKERFPMIDPDSTEHGLFPLGRTIEQRRQAIAALRERNKNRAR